MDDFNANLEYFYTSISKHNKGCWQYTLLHYLQQNRFSDLHQLFSKDPAQPGHTYKTAPFLESMLFLLCPIFLSPRFIAIPENRSYTYLIISS